jgi:hypothetical protein
MEKQPESWNWHRKLWGGSIRDQASNLWDLMQRVSELNWVRGHPVGTHCCRIDWLPTMNEIPTHLVSEAFCVDYDIKADEKQDILFFLTHIFTPVKPSRHISRPTFYETPFPNSHWAVNLLGAPPFPHATHGTLPTSVLALEHWVVLGSLPEFPRTQAASWQWSFLFFFEALVLEAGPGTWYTFTIACVI